MSAVVKTVLRVSIMISFLPYPRYEDAFRSPFFMGRTEQTVQGNFGKDHQQELNTQSNPPHVETKEEGLRPVHVLRSSRKSAGLLLPSAAPAFGNGEVVIGAGVTARRSRRFTLEYDDGLVGLSDIGRHNPRATSLRCP